jgi:hypothetical protein
MLDGGIGSSAAGPPAIVVVRTLSSSVPVPALGSAVVDLTLTAGPFAPLAASGFVVTARAGGTSGSVEGTLDLAGNPVFPGADPDAHGVVPALVPARATAGQGTAANFRVRVTASYDGGPGFVASVSDPVTLVVVDLAPAPDGEDPTVTAVRRFGFHLQPTRLVLTFSEDLEADGATNPADYLLVRRGRDGRFGTRDDRVIRLRGASYNPTTRAVTLRPSRRLRPRDTFLLTVRGLVDRSGNRLDGDGDGRPGGDFVTVVGRRILAGSVSDLLRGAAPARAAGRRSTP